MSPAARPAATSRPPRALDQVLQQVEPARRAVYATVRRILDDLEDAAPWPSLYSPPAGGEDYLRMQMLLVGLIDAIPQQIDVLEATMVESGAPEDLAGDVRFFFRGIHEGVQQDLEWLRALVDEVQQAPERLDADRRALGSEIAADLKGKYASSIMGAAASLVAEGRWNGVELEPVLFPEKAEEFERNQRLVATLAEVVETIGTLDHELPLVDHVASWRRGEPIDRYALTPLYALLGTLGQLMRDTSRRALYSGDYHQIQRREALLSARVHRLGMLHQASCGDGIDGSASTDAPAVSYEQMVQVAIELAAVLDIDLLRELLDGADVDRVLRIVTLEKESDHGVGARGRVDPRTVTPHVLREHLTPEQRALIPLLYDEDLSTFLELLLGSVLKRASLTVRPTFDDTGVFVPDRPGSRAPANPEPAPPEPAPPEPAPPEPAPPEPAPPDPVYTPPPAEEVMPASMRYAGLETPPTPVLSFDEQLESLGDGADGGFGLAEFDLPDLGAFGLIDDDEIPVVPIDEQLGGLRELRALLQRLLGPSPKRRQFEMVLRLLRQKRTVPPAMLQSSQPYLFELMNELVPLLERQGMSDELFRAQGAELMRRCKELCRPLAETDSAQQEMPPRMQKVVNLLDGLNVAVGAAIDRLESA